MHARVCELVCFYVEISVNLVMSSLPGVGVHAHRVTRVCISSVTRDAAAPLRCRERIPLVQSIESSVKFCHVIAQVSSILSGSYDVRQPKYQA